MAVAVHILQNAARERVRTNQIVISLSERAVAVAQKHIEIRRTIAASALPVHYEHVIFFIAVYIADHEGSAAVISGNCGKNGALKGCVTITEHDRNGVDRAAADLILNQRHRILLAVSIEITIRRLPIRLTAGCNLLSRDKPKFAGRRICARLKMFHRYPGELYRLTFLAADWPK